MIYGTRIFVFLAICIFLPQMCYGEMDTFYEDPQVAIGRFMEMNKQWNLFTTKNGHMLANKAMHRKPKSGYNSDLAKLNLTAQCYNDTRKLHKDLEALHEYAIQIEDASAKPTPGIVRGHTDWYGAFSECENAKSVATENGNTIFKGRYCRVWHRIGPSLGQCVADSCNTDDALKITNYDWEVMPIPGFNDFTRISCTKDYPLETGDIATISVIAVLLALVVIATTYDLILRYLAKRSRKEDNDISLVSMNYINGVPKEEIKTASSRKTEDIGNTNGAAASMKGIQYMECVEFRGSVLSLASDASKQGGIASISRDTTGTNGVYQSRQSQMELVGKDHEMNSTIKKNEKATNVFSDMLLAFSAYTNSIKIWSTESPKGSLDCLNGMRVLSMFWVILGHTFFYMLGYLDNGADLLGFVKRFSSMAIVQGTLSVDTFFFLSGLLVAYLTLKQLKKTNGKINWFLFYFHRFWRLTPTLMFIILVYTNLFPRTNYGPNGQWQDKDPTCSKYWWTNLLYINNLYFKSLGEQCAGWTWYLANDMQFFVISPILLYLLHRYKKIGLGLIMFLIIGSLAATCGIVNYYGMTPNVFVRTTKVLDAPGNDFIYSRPYCRIAPYLVGMLVGYALFISKPKMRIHKGLVLLGWAAAITISMLAVYGPHSMYYEGRQDVVWSTDVNALFLGTYRFAFSLGLAWMTFACVKGYGGPVNAILSWRVWIPLGKLNFCAYMIHTMTIFTFYRAKEVHFHFDDLTIVSEYLSNLVVAYGAAFVLSLLVEGPTMRLEKAWFKKRK